MKIALVSTVLALFVQASDTIPQYDIQASCRASTSAVNGTGETMTNCVRDETAARAQVGAVWEKAKPTTRATCAGNERGVKSYVELITCVQMFESLK